MTITIAYYAPLPENAPHYLLELPGAAVAAIVRTAQATRGHRGVVMADDEQYGWYASAVTADILSAAAKTLDMATALTLAPYIWHLRRTRFTVTVECTLGVRWQAHQVSNLTVVSEPFDAPSANWCEHRAYFTLETIGYDPDGMGVAEKGAELPAAELAGRCREALKDRWVRFGAECAERIERLLAIAEYALSVGGPSAAVTAA